MPPNNKKKTLGSVKTAAGGAGLHPYSRKAGQLRRALHRTDRLETAAGAKDRERAKLTERLLALQEPIRLDSSPMAVHSAVKAYLDRHSEEIAQLTKDMESRKGRGLPPRLRLLRTLKEEEDLEYSKHGILLPPLNDARKVKAFLSWTGDWNAIPRLGLIPFLFTPKEESSMDVNSTVVKSTTDKDTLAMMATE